MTALDVFVFLLLFGGGAIGFVRGFVHEVISLFAWVAGIAMLKLFHTQLWTGIQNSFYTSPAAGELVCVELMRPVHSCVWNSLSIAMPATQANSEITS